MKHASSVRGHDPWGQPVLSLLLRISRVITLLHVTDALPQGRVLVFFAHTSCNSNPCYIQLYAHTLQPVY